MSFDVESIFGAIDVIVSNRLDGISYDTTMICTIVDDSDKERSHYVVTDGSIRFDAYTNDTSYKVDDVVRVSVLNGDFSQRKFIAGPYIGNDSSVPVTYIPPLATSFTSTENLISQFNSGVSSGLNISEFQLKTNNTRKKQLWRVNLQDNEEYRNLQANGIYNVITLAADFKTDLGDLASGNYGLRLDLLIQNDLSGESYIHKFITLDSEEMVGNPYSFGIYSNQAKQIQIASGGIITQIALYAYEGVKFVDKTVETDGISTLTYEEVNSEFKYGDGTLLSPSKDIWIKDVVVAFGSDLTKVENNSLQLYTNSSTLYTYGADGTDNNLAENKKNLAFNWYNKTENNEYIGFNDGLDYKNNSTSYNYDEITYNEVNYSDYRLNQQKNQSGVASDEDSLTLAANIAEAKPLMVNAYTMLVTQLPNVLQSLKYQLNGTDFIVGTAEIKGLNELISGNGALLTQYSKQAQEATDFLSKYYKAVLEYGYQVQNGETPSWADVNKKRDTEGNPTSEILFEFDTDYYINFFVAINSAKTAVKDFFTSMYTHTGADKILSGYRSFYDVYYPRVLTILDNISALVDQIPVSIENNGKTSDINKLLSYESKTDYREYASDIDFDSYANRYCVYWYRYNKNYVLRHIDPISEAEWNGLLNKEHSTYSDYLKYCEDMNHEYKYANFAGYNWERIVDLNNVGLPIGTEDNIVTKEDGNNYLPARSLHDWTQQIALNPKTKEEKFKVILFYNHNKIESNIITFENKDTFREEALVDAQDILVINHHLDSQEHYSAYNETYELNDIRDETISRLIKCSYDGLFSGNEALIGAGLYWYVPVTSTMLTYDLSSLKEQGYATDAEGKTPDSRDGFVYFYKQVGEQDETYKEYDNNGNQVEKTRKTAKVDDTFFTYKIKPYYEQSAQNNTIEVWAKIPGTDTPVKGEIFFTFSTSGVSGTKYTLSVTSATPQVAVLPDGNSELKLRLALYDALNEQLVINKDSVLINNVLENVDDAANKPEGCNLKISWYGYHNPYYNIIQENDTREGSKDIFITITKAQSDKNTSAISDKFIGILKIVVQFDLDDSSKVDLKDFVTLYPVSYAANKDLFIQGPTSIVYNNQGTVAKLSQSPYDLYQHQSVDDDGNIITTGDLHIGDCSWSIKYYDKNGAYIADNDLVKAYMPQLNTDKTLIAAPLYLSCPDDQRYTPMVTATRNNSILWTQPIVIVQNKYGASILNDWDGSLKIDEANGTIMTTMLGAGKKTSNNTFEGVLIGDITKPTNGFDVYNADGVGMYGFNDGAQSFFFGVNGKAFLGKSGRGRISFNGNDGFIYSGNWLSSFGDRDGDGNYEDDPFRTLASGQKALNAGTAGLAIDLQEGHIDAYNFKVTSKNIYLNSNPPDLGYYFRIGNNGGTTPIDPSLTDNDANGVPEMTRGYIAMTKEGDLDIRTNSLSITGQLGGVNLLRQTEPKRIIPIKIKHATTQQIVPATDTNGDPIFDWNVAKQSNYNNYKTYCTGHGFEPLSNAEWNNLPELAWSSSCAMAGSYPNSTFTEVASLNSKKNYLAITSSTSGNRSVSQKITEIKKGESYTVSGYVSGMSANGTLTISFDKAITIPQWSEGKNSVSYYGTRWVKFEHTIVAASDDTDITITFSGTNNFALWHAKFESGAIASAWSPAPSDTEDTIAGEQEKYDIYLSQDKIFDKLITDDNGEKMVGIWLLPGEDTASGHNELYINATYMATGILRSSNWNGTLTKKNTGKTDVYGRSIYTYGISKHPTQGIYFNLDEGKLWAATFELTARSSNNGLYLNSHPGNSEDWLFAGDGIGDSNSYIKFGKNSSGDSILKMQINNNFMLKTSSIYLSDTAKSYDDLTYYDSDSGEVKTDGTDDIVLRVGSNFGVSSSGTLYAKDAQFHGKIYSQSGKIGGWSIGIDALTNGPVSLNSSTGTVSGAKISGGEIDIGNGVFTVSSGGLVTMTQGSITLKDSTTFHVSNEGHLTCNSATIGGWTVTSAGFSNGNGVSFGTGGFKDTSGFSELTDLKVSGSLKVTGTAEFTGNTTIGGTLTVTSDVVLNSASFKVGDAQALAQTIEVEVDTPWSLKTGKMVFTNGLLTSWAEVKSSAADVLANLLGGTGTSVGGEDQPVYIANGAFKTTKKLGALAFEDDIKKKFKVTVSGTIKKANHSYYVVDGSAGYWEQGTPGECWVEVPGQIWTREVTNYTGWAITDTKSRAYHYDSTNKLTYYNAGTWKTYTTYKKAGDLSVSITGTSGNVTLEPSGGLITDTVDISVTGGTVTIS